MNFFFGADKSFNSTQFVILEESESEATQQPSSVAVSHFAHRVEEFVERAGCSRARHNDNTLYKRQVFVIKKFILLITVFFIFIVKHLDISRIFRGRKKKVLKFTYLLLLYSFNVKFNCTKLFVLVFSVYYLSLVNW